MNGSVNFDSELEFLLKRVSRNHEIDALPRPTVMHSTESRRRYVQLEQNMIGVTACIGLDCLYIII